MSRSAAIPIPVFPPPSDLASSTNLTLPSSGRDHSTANEQSEEEEEEEETTESQPGGYLKPARSTFGDKKMFVWSLIFNFFKQRLNFSLL